MLISRQVLAAACLLLAAGAVHAQELATSQPASEQPANATGNFAEFTARGTAFTAGSDSARFMRYQDLRNGRTLDIFRYTTSNASTWFNAQADHVGYRDQRFAVAVNDFGTIRASLEYNQIPLFFSDTTKTLYTASPGNPFSFRIDDAVQAGLQNQKLPYASLDALATPFDLRLKRSIADFKAIYSATAAMDVDVWVRSAAKSGNQPWAGSFGFSDAVALAIPVQTRTTDLGLGIEWASARGSARLGYDGSFFKNDVDTIVWDNPLRVSDSPTLGPLQGQMSVWPDSNLNAANASGLLNLPGRTRATAYVSVGNWTQDNPLIPFTINSALPAIPLDRPTSDASARVTSTNFSVNTRPIEDVSATLRFRSYDFDNRTPVFHVANTVAYDTAVEAFAEGGTSPYSTSRKTFDADISLTPLRYTALRAGYTREVVDQTFRTFDTTTEDTLRLSADASGISWLMLRAVYEHAKRTGSGLDEQSLDDIGEQISLRQFDISDRVSNRVSIIAQLTPVSAVSLNGTVSAGNEDRGATVFGLRSNDNRGYSFGVDYVPSKAVSLGANYEWERYTSVQASREANPGPQFNDPTRDWTTDGADRASTFDASMDLLGLLRNTDVRLGYDLSHAESVYVYGLAPNTTLPPVVQLPAVVNQLQRATVDIRHRFTTHVAAGVVYWFDKYAVNDFAAGAQTLTTIAQPSFLMIGYIDRPYTANTLQARFTYFW